MRTRVRSIEGGWMADHLTLGLFWLPFGRWIHQDWWAPHVFDTAEEAIEFVWRRTKE